MKKLFISADIEGTAGIVNWNETERSVPHDYDYFANQMTREVAAACGYDLVNHHHALADAEACAAIALKLL